MDGTAAAAPCSPYPPPPPASTRSTASTAVRPSRSLARLLALSVRGRFTRSAASGHNTHSEDSGGRAMDTDGRRTAQTRETEERSRPNQVRAVVRSFLRRSYEQRGRGRSGGRGPGRRCQSRDDRDGHGLECRPAPSSLSLCPSLYIAVDGQSSAVFLLPWRIRRMGLLSALARSSSSPPHQRHILPFRSPPIHLSLILLELSLLLLPQASSPFPGVCVRGK